MHENLAIYLLAIQQIINPRILKQKEQVAINKIRSNKNKMERPHKMLRKMLIIAKKHQDSFLRIWAKNKII